MLRKFQSYIEQEPLEEKIKRQERCLNRFIVAVLILAAIWFSPVILHIFTR